MITRSLQFDLGLDNTRIKDQRDAARQEATVDALLRRLFNDRLDRRWELQVLADEVGMGKTFVGLGTAYSVLEAMRNGKTDDDLRGCYQKVLIITPQNSALYAKWNREVGEFVKRCVKEEYRKQAGYWYAAIPVDRVDDLVYELRRPGAGPQVIVASMSIFGGGRLRNYKVKRRHLLGVLFRHWSVRFRIDQRERLLKGNDDWPHDPREINDFTAAERDELLFSDDELLVALRQLDSSDECVEKLLESCKEIATPYMRKRDEVFKDERVEAQLVDVYRKLMGHMIHKALPLVIVDEAHNWKNGPSLGSNGYRGFVQLLGNRTRRILLLTATPFQLRPAEMLEILKVGDQLSTCPTEAESSSRSSRLAYHRENVIRPVLNSAATSSRKFAGAWSKLPTVVRPEMIEAAWNSTSLVEARVIIQTAVNSRRTVSDNELKSILDKALTGVDPDVRQLLREGLLLLFYNGNLSRELGAIVIRHRRHTEHRLFRVGMEYQPAAINVKRRPDRHVLHSAPGIDVRGDGELPHYILMRCVSEMKQGKGKTSLGNALTGCYSTLIHSAEGRDVKKRLTNTEIGKVYLNLLMGMVNERHDSNHPKVREVVDAAHKNWQSGEKTLIFCFRTNTAQRLHDIITQRIRGELHKRRNRCMGGPESLKALRARLTGRDRDLIALGLDRVLWAVLWSEQLLALSDRQISPDDFELREDDLQLLAEVGLRYGVDLLAERVDRVFLHRATEHVIARRLARVLNPQGDLKQLLSQVSNEEWIRGPYGLSPGSDDDEAGAELTQFDERGVHYTYERAAEVDLNTVNRIALELRERRNRANRQGQIALLDVYARGPNLWLGSQPGNIWTGRKGNARGSKVVREMHEYLFALTKNDGKIDWETRRLAMQAIRRAILRESMLLRLLPDRKERDETGWGDLLVQSFFSSLPGQRESMADRIAVFLEDLMAASGNIKEQGSARFALYDATKLGGQQLVALVSGDTDQQPRERIFSGFNTPLLPEVLICTSVGQEGIDLHRQCRHVVHFDLAWNPAVLEQRTGRADRIGSKTFRERALSSVTDETFLEIGVPYLAGTYDERMYEELRLRAQIFEVLTGGDLVADDAEGNDDQKQAEGQEAGLRFVPIPDSMMNSLRVYLHVWSDPGDDENGPAGTKR